VVDWITCVSRAGICKLYRYGIEYVLCRRQVVCQAHVESVALLRAEVVEDGLDLSQRHLPLQFRE